MIHESWRALAVAVLTAVLALSLAPGHGRSPAASGQIAGSLRLSAEVAEPGAVIEARGRVGSRSKRRVVLQRRQRDYWRSVARGTSSPRGRFVLKTTLPHVPASLVRYRVKVTRQTLGNQVLPRRFTPVAAVRTTDGSTATPVPVPTTPPTTPVPTTPVPTTPAPTTPVPTTPPSSPVPTPSPPPTTEPVDPVVADWKMDEPLGSTTMIDSSGQGHHGAISPDAAAAGLVLNGAYYAWSSRCPDCAPLAVARVVQVPDSSALEIPDPTVSFALEFRFRTTAAYGNLMQKGQSHTAGGQFKVENPERLRCVFKGADGATEIAQSPRPLNDGVWHTVACVHTASSVQQWVDGVLVAETAAGVGRIDNAFPFVIGGKTECDQQAVGCDYFSGSIDWTRISRG